jgi:Ca2+-binding RTX toxin-like protein
MSAFDFEWVDGFASSASVSVQKAENSAKLSGTLFADMLTGDDGDNTIQGNAGNDTLIGGAGNDIALFSGNYAD